MTVYCFDENNSGGHWWLKRAHFEALFAGGWRYAPENETEREKKPLRSDDDVPYGWRHNLKGEFPSLRAAVESFERATGMDFFEQGCNCCGAPFSIHTEYGSKDYQSISGDSVEHKPARPW